MARVADRVPCHAISKRISTVWSAAAPPHCHSLAFHPAILTFVLLYQGFQGLYKGVGPPVVMVGILNGIMFGVNGQMKRLVAFGAGKESSKDLSLPQVKPSLLKLRPSCP